MHPPPFLQSHRLLDWPDTVLELRCCKGVTFYPVRLLAQRSGDLTFAQVLARLRCKKCGLKPSGPIYLCASYTRTFQGGCAPDWSIELVPERRG